METAAGNLNPFLNAETTPRKKVKLQPRRILPVESPAACGPEGQEIPGSVFESAVEGFASHRSEEQPVPVIQQPVPVVPQPVPVVPQTGYIFPSSGLFYPSPAQGVPGLFVNVENLPAVNMRERGFLNSSVPPTGEGVSIVNMRERGFLNSSVPPVVTGEGVPIVNMREREFLPTSISPVVNGSELRRAIGTISPPSVFPRGSAGLTPIQEQGVERSSGIDSAVEQPVVTAVEVDGQQFGIPTSRVPGAPEFSGSTNPFTPLLRSTPLNGSVCVTPAVSFIRGSFRRSVARERRRMQVFLEN